MTSHIWHKKSMEMFFYFHLQCHIHNNHNFNHKFAAPDFANANILASPNLSGANIAYQEQT